MPSAIVDKPLGPWLIVKNATLSTSSRKKSEHEIYYHNLNDSFCVFYYFFRCWSKAITLKVNCALTKISFLLSSFIAHSMLRFKAHTKRQRLNWKPCKLSLSMYASSMGEILATGKNLKFIF